MSRFVDHSVFQWADRNWDASNHRDAVIYELHIGTFTAEGTFDSAISNLSYLTSSGVTHLEVMPVGQFPGDRGWGSDVVLPFAPQHSYDGPEALKRFVDACHYHHLAVVLDVVYNHFGPSGNVLPEYGPYQSKKYQTPWDRD